MTKILFVAGTAERGGASLSLFNLIKGLNERGYKCAVIFGRNGPVKCDIDSLGVLSYVVPFRADYWPHLSCVRDWVFFIPRFLLLIKNMFVYPRIRRIVKRFDPDIVHSNYSITTIGFRVAKDLGKPHIWHIREYIDKDFHLTPFPNRSSHLKKLRSSETITITQDLADYFNLPHAHVVYNGIVEDNCQLREANKQDFFLYVGNVTIMKGALDLLQSFISFAKENNHTRLVFVGSINSSVRSQMEKYINQNGLDNRVVLEGKKDNVRDFMEKAIAIVVPSRFEGFGRITAEAMGFGCLVIGRNTGGTKEQFDNGVKTCGREIGFRYNTDEELVSTMKSVLNLPKDDLDRIRVDAYNTVNHLYTNKAYVDGIESVYTFMLKSNEAVK